MNSIRRRLLVALLGALLVAGIAGAGATFVGAGPVTADGASLYALSGGRIDLPGLTRYAHAAPANDQTYTLRAEGFGSVLILSGLTQITGGTRWNSDLSIEALAGGQVHPHVVLEHLDVGMGQDPLRQDALHFGPGHVLGVNHPPVGVAAFPA